MTDDWPINQQIQQTDRPTKRLTDHVKGKLHPQRLKGNITEMFRKAGWISSKNNQVALLENNNLDKILESKVEKCSESSSGNICYVPPRGSTSMFPEHPLAHFIPTSSVPNMDKKTFNHYLLGSFHLWFFLAISCARVISHLIFQKSKQI